jgi:hypothetical protein
MNSWLIGLARSARTGAALPTPSLESVFVGEPQTNGVAGRFNRMLKEQAIHGRRDPWHDPAHDRALSHRRPPGPKGGRIVVRKGWEVEHGRHA